jgi:MOSC domain-containing protein YiiM
LTAFRIAALCLGRSAPFGPQGQPSAIDKRPVAGAVMAGALGLQGDEQGDPHRHGGPDKAVHCYPVAHYPLWAAELPAGTPNLRHGGFGENLAVDGIDEAGLCLGDLWRVGEALMQVSQSRQPCWKLNLRFGLPDMARRVQDTGRSGWYFRVVEPGRVVVGDGAALVARPQADWPLDRVAQVLYRDRLNRTALADLAALPDLPESWRRLALARLDSGRVEEWRQRLETPLA